MPSGPLAKAALTSALPRSLRSSFVHLATFALALLSTACLQAATPTFTIAGNIFPSTPLGQSTTQSITVTVNAGVAIKSIALQSGFTEYSLGAISGCTVDGKTVNAIGAVCTIPVTFTPKALGSTASPATARTAPLLVTDIEAGSPVTYGFGLLGASTGPLVQFTPATLTRVAGAAATGYPAGDQGLGYVATSYAGDNGPALSANFGFLNIFSVYDEPAQSMAVDSAGNIFVIDFANQIIRRIDGATNIVTTIAGVPKTFGRTGDGGPATSAEIETPASLALDAADNVYFTDAGTATTYGSYTLRTVNSATGIINSIAGQNFTLPYPSAGGGTCVQSGQGYQWEPTCGDGGLATYAFLYNPQALAFDGAGNIYILQEQGTIRRIDAVTGIITTVANAVPSGNGQALSMTMGADGNLYAAVYDSTNANDVLTQIDPSTKAVKVALGGATAPSSTTCVEQGSVATDWFADFSNVYSPGLSADGAGNIYGQSGECDGGETTSSFRYNIASGLAYAFTQGGGGEGGQGTQNGIYNSFGGSYAIQPALSIADGAGNIYFQTLNQIAKLSASNGALNGFGSRYDYQTDAAGTVCGQYTGSFCESAVIANIGNAPLNTSYALSSGFSFLTLDDPAACVSGVLAPGDFCNLDIEFTPITVGTVNGAITVTDNADLQNSGTQTLVLAGTGVAAPEISFSPATLSFGNQAINTTSAIQTVTISNPGTGPNTLDGIYVASSTFGIFTVPGGTCPLTSGTLAAGATCTVQIAFAPTALQSYSGTLTVNNNVGNGVLLATTVTGTGISGGTAQATLSPATLAFPDTTVGSTATAITATLSNPGTATLTGIAITIAGANPADFAQSATTCTTTLNAGDSCTISVTFTPASAASFAATLSVADSASPSPQTASLTGTGIAAAKPVFLSPVGTALGAQPVTVTIATAGTLGSIQVLTQGAANLDFTQGTGGTCAIGTAYTAGQTCTVNVAFKPQFPGARNGAIQIYDDNSILLATAYIPGTGTGPQVVFAPGTQSTLPSGPGFSQPLGGTVDAAGNFYVADTLDSRIIEIPKTASGYGTPVILPTHNLNSPSDVAIDGSGNLFIADTGNFSVEELPWNGVSYGAQIVLANETLADVTGIAVDGNGNLFFSDGIDKKVFEMPRTSSGYGAMTTVSQATGLFAPHGLAFDANQNLFIANSGEHTVVELPATPTGFGAEITLPLSNLNYPQGVAVDGGGNLYIVDSSVSGVIRLPWSGTAFGTPTTLPLSGLGNATGVSVDGAGNLYVIDAANSNALKLDLTPPSLTFKSTNVGSVSTDSPQSVPVTNIGNKSLTFSGSATDPNYPANFPENTTDTALCASGTPLTQGATCDVSVNFKPTVSGPLSGAIVLTDNTLNVANSTQSIPVSGNGVGEPTAATPVITPGTGTYTTNQTVTITDSTAGATIYYSTDGSTPTTNSTQYTAPFVISRTGTNVQAIAVASGYANSAVALAVYTLNAITPTLTPPGGTYNAPQTVTLATTTPGASIYYSTNGIPPTTESTLYTAPISVTVSGTQIQAIAALSGYNLSPVASGTYIITPPTASLTPSTLVFGNQPEGSSTAAQTLTLKNTGAGTLTGIAISLSESSQTNILRARASIASTSDYSATTTCGSTLAAGATCTIAVTFDPQSLGSLPGSVTVSDNASNSPQTASLTGTGTAPAAPVASLAPTSLNFGNQSEGATSAAQTVTLSNTGNASLTGITVSLSESSNDDLARRIRPHVVTASTDYAATTTCGSTLAAGATCTIAVTFDPQSLGSLPGSVTVTDNASNSPQTASLSGTGTAAAAPAASLTPATLTFTSTTGTASAAQKATLSNTGNAALTISGITLTGTNPADFSQTNTCGSSLAAGATCTISVVFTPASAASFTATLSVADNAAGSPQTSALTGTGTAPAGDFALSATPGTQTIAAGSTATYNVAVSATPSGATFSTAVTLTASGLPPGATASFSPASVTPGSGSANSTLKIQTAAAATTAAHKSSNWPTALAAPSMAFLTGGMILLFRRRKFTQTLRKLYPVLILAGLGLASLAVMGCNGGFALPKPTPVATTYTITITGAAGEDTHSTTVTLTVN